MNQLVHLCQLCCSGLCGMKCRSMSGCFSQRLAGMHPSVHLGEETKQHRKAAYFHFMFYFLSIVQKNKLPFLYCPSRVCRWGIYNNFQATSREHCVLRYTDGMTKIMQKLMYSFTSTALQYECYRSGTMIS